MSGGVGGDGSCAVVPCGVVVGRVACASPGSSASTKRACVVRQKVVAHALDLALMLVSVVRIVQVGQLVLELFEHLHTAARLEPHSCRQKGGDAIGVVPHQRLLRLLLQLVFVFDLFA
eukprot:6095053-Pleurochrysis_carterae.AAC.1